MGARVARPASLVAPCPRNTGRAPLWLSLAAAPPRSHGRGERACGGRSALHEAAEEPQDVYKGRVRQRQTSFLPPATSHALSLTAHRRLLAYNGMDRRKPLLLALKGRVIDVSAGADFYGPGGPYGIFAGKDARRRRPCESPAATSHGSTLATRHRFLPLHSVLCTPATLLATHSHTLLPTCTGRCIFEGLRAPACSGRRRCGRWPTLGRRSPHPCSPWPRPALPLPSPCLFPSPSRAASLPPPSPLAAQ